MQLYATGAATATSAAQVTIPVSARIRAIQVALTMDTSADNTAVSIEFSKVPTNQVAVNGAQDPFLEVRLYSNLAANGQLQSGVNKVFPVDIQCKAGEIIYVHATVTGVATYYVNAIIWY